MNTQEKINLIKSFSTEIINEEELTKLLETKKEIIAYDGFEPSGQIHIAQGLLRAINVNKLTKCGIKFKFFIADYFAMLNNKYGGDLEKIQTAGKYFIEVWKSCGMDLENVEFVWAKKFYEENPSYWETFLKLSNQASIKRVLKCGQIMGREDSINNNASQIIYPLMQATDVIHLGADICQLGLDQRKVNMLARDIFPKIGDKKPIVISHGMLLGLQKINSDKEGNDKKIEMKMSKSKPNTAIFMTDTDKEVENKLKKAHCIDGVVEDNPILEYFKMIIFEKYENVEFERPEKFGGLYKTNSYENLENDFIENKIKSFDLKLMCSKYINKMLEPTRIYFNDNQEAKKILEKVKKF